MLRLGLLLLLVLLPISAIGFYDNSQAWFEVFRLLGISTALAFGRWMVLYAR